MPTPVSSTSTNRRKPPSGCASVRARKAIRPPLGVNLTALPSRLVRIWRSLVSSATRDRGT